MRPIALLAVAATFAAACSSQPTTPPAASAPVATVAAAPIVAAPAAPSGATSAAAQAVPTGAPSASSAGTTAKPGKIPSGYRMEKRNGKEVYCRNITTLGSRFAEKTCFTREQLEEVQKRTESAMDDLEQGLKVCAGGGACQGT